MEEKPNGGEGTISARKEKRTEWWIGNLDKRLGSVQNETGQPPGGGWSSDGRLSARAKKNSALPNNEDAKAEDSSGKIVDTCDKQMKRNTPFTIFVGQIPYDAKEEEVRKLFEKAGVIKTFRWRINPETKKFKGFAFVDYENKNGYKRAFQLHHSIVNGRPVNVEATITGGRKSRHRAINIKDRTTKLQQEAKEALERKAKNEARNKTNQKTEKDATSDVKTEGVRVEPQCGGKEEEIIPSASKKRLRTARTARANKRLKAEGAALAGSGPDKPTTTESQTLKPSPVEKTNVFRTATAKPDNFIKPREGHLTVLSNAKTHIKFEE